MSKRLISEEQRERRRAYDREYKRQRRLDDEVYNEKQRRISRDSKRNARQKRQMANSETVKQPVGKQSTPGGAGPNLYKPRINCVCGGIKYRDDDDVPRCMTCGKEVVEI